MKLLFISPSFFPATYYGGPIYSTYQLAKTLKKQNVDIKVVTTNANGKKRLDVKTGKYQHLENELPVKYYTCFDSKGTSVSMFLNLWRDVKNTDIVYLISVFSPATVLTIINTQIFNKTLLLSSQGQLGEWCLAHGNLFKKYWLMFLITPFISRINWHVTSEDEEKMLKVVYPGAKTFILPNGIDLESFSFLPGEKNKSFYNTYTGYSCQPKKIIVSMGRLDKIKGFDILIEAFHAILKEFNESILLIAGEDFGEKEELENAIQQRKLEGKVFLVGKLEGNEKIEFLHNAEVFALASHHENFGLVYAEALAAGTPIVASKSTPWHDVEKHNCGRWVNNTPEKFAEAICEIFNSDFIKMGERGKNFIEESYNWEKIALAFTKTFHAINENRLK